MSASLLAHETGLVPWASAESQVRLVRSVKTDFFKLSNFFVSQDNGLYCGLASSAIVLNALYFGDAAKELPEDKTSIAKEETKFLPEGFNPYFKKVTQNNLLNDRTKTKLQVLGAPAEGTEKADYGLQLRQLVQVLTSHGAKVDVRVVTDDASEAEIKKELIENLSRKDDYVLVNYKRADLLAQGGGGHISPLGAYDEESDSFLIMDVNPNKATWVWAPADTLIKAMRTFDTVENRGYLLIQK
jgi:hypothetical protein